MGEQEWGPTGSETRKLRKDAGPRTWPLMKFTETPLNAQVEFSRAKTERGELGQDIVLPKDTKKPTRSPVRKKAMTRSR